MQMLQEMKTRIIIFFFAYICTSISVWKWGYIYVREIVKITIKMQEKALVNWLWSFIPLEYLAWNSDGIHTKYKNQSCGIDRKKKIMLFSSVYQILENVVYKQIIVTVKVATYCSSSSVFA